MDGAKIKYVIATLVMKVQIVLNLKQNQDVTLLAVFMVHVEIQDANAMMVILVLIVTRKPVLCNAQNTANA